MKKYIRLDCDNVGDKIEYFLYSSEVDKAQELNNRIKDSITQTVIWIKDNFNDCEILLIGADDIFFATDQVTPAKINKLRDFFFHLSKVTISIGIGDTLKDSMQNLLIAKVAGKNQAFGG